jgi:hypothetical protein
VSCQDRTIVALIVLVFLAYALGYFLGFMGGRS